MAPLRRTSEEEAHDVLAAEAFAVPAPDPALHHVQPPEDPSGIPDAHDILSAEEFAMPAPDGGVAGKGSRGGVTGPGSRGRTVIAAAVGVLGALLLRARRSR